METTTKEKLPLRKIMQEAWQQVHGCKLNFFLAFLMTIVTYLVLAIFATLLHHAPWTRIVFLIFEILLQAGMTYLGIRQVFKQPLSTIIVFKAFTPRLALYNFLAIIATYVLFFLINLIFFLLAIFLIHSASGPIANFMFYCIIALGFFIGIYVLIRFSLVMSVIMAQKEATASTAFSESYHATEGCFWKILGFYFFSILLLLLGLSTLGIGFIWIIPFLFITWGLIYRHLIGDKFTNG